MTKKGFRNVSLKDKDHERLTEVSNILGLTRPDAINELVDRFFRRRQEVEQKLKEEETS